jgi:hypothetical protein
MSASGQLGQRGTVGAELQSKRTAGSPAVSRNFEPLWRTPGPAQLERLGARSDVIGRRERLYAPLHLGKAGVPSIG